MNYHQATTDLLGIPPPTAEGTDDVPIAVAQWLELEQKHGLLATFGNDDHVLSGFGEFESRENSCVSF